jgi:magnesium-transporting ATPase (P-type)
LLLTNQAELIEFFLFCMSMCHECVLNSNTSGTKADQIVYEGNSPDEIALVDTARWLGWVYKGNLFTERVV